MPVMDKKATTEDIPVNPQTWLPDDAQVKLIAAAVAEYNAGRPAMASQLRRRLLGFLLPVAVIAVAVVAAGVATAMPVIAGIGVAIAILGGAFAITLARGPAEAFQQKLRSRLFPVIFGFIDYFEYEHGRTPSFLGRLVATGLLNYNKWDHDDWFAGSHEGVQFEMIETHLSKKSGKNTRTIFDGLIFHLHRNTDFRGLLMSQKRSNAVTRIFRDLFGDTLKEIETGVGDIDSTHEFRTDTPGPESRELAIRMAKVLDWLQEEWRHGPVQIAFSGTDCYLLLAARKDHFELPGITETDIEYERHILPLIRDMVTLLAIAGLIRKIDSGS